MAVACFSCSDDDDENNDKDLIGTWELYKKDKLIFILKFEYNGDEISFPEGLIPSGVIPKGIPGVSETGINVAIIKMALAVTCE